MDCDKLERKQPMKLTALPYLLLALTTSLPAEVLFRATFETGDLTEWANTGTRSQNATPRNIQLVTDIVQSGKYAAKVTIHEDDVFNASQLRAQLGGPRVTVEEGSDTYMSFHLYMADEPKDRDNFFYWEGNPPPRYNNVMTWWIEPSPSGGALIKYGTGNLGRNGTHWEAPFTTGKWHHLTMHIRWSEDSEKATPASGSMAHSYSIKNSKPKAARPSTSASPASTAAPTAPPSTPSTSTTSSSPPR
jgi:hypothetical protein